MMIMVRAIYSIKFLFNRHVWKYKKNNYLSIKICLLLSYPLKRKKRKNEDEKIQPRKNEFY